MTPGLSRRRLLGAAALGTAAAATGLTACGSSSGQDAAAGSGTKPTGHLTLMYESSEVTPKILTDFKKLYPGITITRVDLDQTKLMSMIAAGQEPDLFEAVGVWDTPYWAARGMAEPLDTYIAKSTRIKVDDLDPVNDIWKFDGTNQGQGQYYGLSKDYSQDGTLWANKTVFDQAGVTLPTPRKPLSYAEVLTIGRKLTKRSGGHTQVFGLGQLGSPRLLNLLPMVESQGASLFSPDFTKIDFTSDPSIEALSFYWAVAKEGLATGPLNKSSQSDDQLFMANRVGLILDGYWLSGEISSSPSAKNAYMLPAAQLGTAKRVSPCYYGVGMMMSSKSKNKAAAWAFFDYFIGGPPATARAKKGWGLPSLKPLEADLPQSQPYQKRSLKVERQEQKYLSVLKFTPYATNSQIQTILDDEFANAIQKGDVHTYARTITTKVNRLIADGKSQVS